MCEMRTSIESLYRTRVGFPIVCDSERGRASRLYFFQYVCRRTHHPTVLICYMTVPSLFNWLSARNGHHFNNCNKPRLPCAYAVLSPIKLELAKAVGSLLRVIIFLLLTMTVDLEQLGWTVANIIRCNRFSETPPDRWTREKIKHWPPLQLA